MNSFGEGILSNLNTEPATGSEPDYKKIIPASYLRRMSKVIKMGIATAITAKSTHKTNGILIGTGLGCFDNSAIFTREYYGKKDELLSPIAFIQSTDNTIAGQLALILQDTSYNITYLHKGIAFENALLDAMLRVNETGKKMLVGGVDEKLDLFAIKSANEKVGFLGEGASFFVVGKEREGAMACVKNSFVMPFKGRNMHDTAQHFLSQNDLVKPGLVLYGNSFLNQAAIPARVVDAEVLDYSALSGIYYSNPAFALHLASEILSNPELAAEKDLKAEDILIVNNFNDHMLGLTYLSAC